jgi:hypothetical protein
MEKISQFLQARERVIIFYTCVASFKKLGKPEARFTASVHAQNICFFLIRKCDALVIAKCQQRLQNKDTTHAQMQNKDTTYVQML